MMDICTITEFREALLDSHYTLTPLSRVEADIESIHRSTYFAECRARLNGEAALLHVPITRHSMSVAMRANAALYASRGDRHMTPFRVYGAAMQLPHTSRRCTVIVEPLSDSVPLAQALHESNYQRLMEGLEGLQTMLDSYDISHNNLTIGNIVVDRKGGWRPIRQYYTTRGRGGDSGSFQSLARAIEELAPREAILCDTAPYTTRHISESHPPLVEGLRRISTPDGVGFEDEHHNVVIAPRWQWADDFREGRAAVMSHDGLMGLINKRGEEVIPVIYNDIQYSTTTGESWVSNGHGWALFDYCGVQITDWQELNTADIIR